MGKESGRGRNGAALRVVAAARKAASIAENVGGRVLDRVPGGKLVRATLTEAEHTVLMELRRRMDLYAPPQSLPGPGVESGAPAASKSAAGPAAAKTVGDLAFLPLSPADMFMHLLDKSIDMSRKQAMEALYLSILHQITPDEVRIIAALSEGDHVPMLHVGASVAPVGPITQRVYSNASNIGKDAGVLLPKETARYITRLRELDVISAAGEDKEQKTRYEILESDQQVREACNHVENTLKMKPRIIRRRIFLSEFGLGLWQACKGELPEDEEDQA